MSDNKEYITVRQTSEVGVFTVFSVAGDELGVVQNPGKMYFTCYLGEKNWEVELWEMEQIINFMNIGPCPECKGYVHPEKILIHCTECNYVLCSG